MRILTTVALGLALLAPAEASAPVRKPVKKAVARKTGGTVRRAPVRGRGPSKMRPRTRPAGRYAVPIPAAPPPDTGQLVLPIETLDATDLKDSFRAPRIGHIHHAIDIMQPRGTPVHAVADGVIAKMAAEGAGGTTLYQFDEQGQYCYYYAHLNAYAEGIAEQQTVHRGDVIGFVGSTGNAPADAPHLHFTILRLGADRQLGKAVPVNPYPVLRSVLERPRALPALEPELGPRATDQ